MLLGSSPSLIGPSDLVVYSQLLETTKAWVMNGTRCPLLATALMCASAIDTNRACSRILVDNWYKSTTSDAFVSTKEQILTNFAELRLEISVQGGGKLGEKMLYVTQQLRHALACCLASSLATCSHATVAETAEKAVRAQLAGDSSAGAGELGIYVSSILLTTLYQVCVLLLLPYIWYICVLTLLSYIRGRRA